MPEVFIAGDHVITSLGFGTSSNLECLYNEVTGIRMVPDGTLLPSPVSASLVDPTVLEEEFLDAMRSVGKDVDPGSFTHLEKLFIVSIFRATCDYPALISDQETLLVLSTTKGNIDLLEPGKRDRFPSDRIFLWQLAKVIQDYFGFIHPPLIISNACISGLVAILTAARYMQAGWFRHAVVSGGDILSEFVVSGFHSFQSLSQKPCRPFDTGRDGLSLGEGAATMVLSTSPLSFPGEISITGSATTNDANHISGPSRTGYELSLAMSRALSEAGLSPGEIGFINAHGTATPFNDEMESKALALAQLLGVPVNSFKGYFGHTLGAAGVVESVLSVHSLLRDRLIRSGGFAALGVPEPISVIDRAESRALRNCLKTASGFGGCNAAIVFQKHGL